MPKKTVTKKERKTVTVINAPVVHFDLTFENEKENQRILMALQSLKNNAGWQFLTQVLTENKNIMATQIIKKSNLNGGKLTEEQTDELRYKHDFIEEIIEKPDFFLNKLSPKYNPDNNLDPYN